MKKYLIIIFLNFLLYNAFAAKEIIPMWISYPGNAETNLADFYFKSEFKYKDSVENATLMVASTGSFRLWINGKLVILKGQASDQLNIPNITLTQVGQFIEKGENTLTMIISPDAQGNIPKELRIAFYLLINNEFKVVSDENTMCYFCNANEYNFKNGLVYFNYNPQKSIVGNWHGFDFNYKKFSPDKWLEAEPTNIFKTDSCKTILLEPFSGLIEVKSLNFPITIKGSEKITVPLTGTKAKQIRFSIESVKNKKIVMQTPDMKQKEVEFIYNTSFGNQVYEFPFLIQADTLFLQFSGPAKFNSIHYVELK